MHRGVHPRPAGPSYVTQVDRVATDVVANDWAVDDSRFLLYPALRS